jgi:hypothetical protein
MELLNKEMLIKHINDKRENYCKRRDAVKSEKKTQEVIDYNLKLMVLDNLLFRINKGEFNVYTVKETVEKETGLGGSDVETTKSE